VVTSEGYGASSEVSRELTGWLRAYFRSPAVASKAIRSLLEENREEFYACASRALVRFEDTPGGRFLLELLLERDMLVPVLCEPAVPEERVLAVMESLLKRDSHYDLRLAQAVAEQAQNKQRSGSREGLLRVINHLEQLGDPKRISPRLLPLLRHPDKHLRSKVVGIIGRCGHSCQWISKQIADPDPRTRANAVEGLWAISDEEARGLLKKTLADTNNRVLGNVLLGLYRMGDAGSITELVKMAARRSPLFRASAAWAMGETRDARFRRALNTLAEDEKDQVRRRAALSIEQLEAEAARPDPVLPWRVETLLEASGDGGAERQLRVAVQCADGSEPPLIPPTQFRPAEDGAPVMEYRVMPLEAPGQLALALLAPFQPDDSPSPMAAAVSQALAKSARRTCTRP
jgi:HEAT repeat protein